jgi:hypothetical protein
MVSLGRRAQARASARAVILHLALLGSSALVAACGSSSHSGGSPGGATSGTGGASGRTGMSGMAGRGTDGGRDGASGRGGAAGRGDVAAGGDAAGGSSAGDGGGGGLARAGAGGSGESGQSGASGMAGSGGEDPTSDCLVDGCPSGAECLPVDGSCGRVACQDPEARACVERPTCGCDGAIYSSNCAAYAAGVSIQGVIGIGDGSRCPTPPDGYFDCLGVFCDSATEYCDMHRHYGSSSFPVACQAGDPWTAAACHPLPAACDGDSSCSCVTSEPFAPGVDVTCTPACTDTNGVTRSCMSGCFG